MVANSLLGIASPALRVVREFAVSGRSNGVGLLPSVDRNRKWATVGTGLGFCSANDTSNGVRVLPSAKYQRRDSFGSGGGGGMSAVAGRPGWRATVSVLRGGMPSRIAAMARARFKMPEP